MGCGYAQLSKEEGRGKPLKVVAVRDGLPSLPCVEQGGRRHIEEKEARVRTNRLFSCLKKRKWRIRTAMMEGGNGMMDKGANGRQIKGSTRNGRWKQAFGSP